MYYRYTCIYPENAYIAFHRVASVAVLNYIIQLSGLWIWELWDTNVHLFLSSVDFNCLIHKLSFMLRFYNISKGLSIELEVRNLTNMCKDLPGHSQIALISKHFWKRKRVIFNTIILVKNCIILLMHGRV